ncbi:GntR family transcriptional regulator [soil metagenome]
MQYAAEFRVEAKTREQATYEVLRREIIAGRWADRQPLVTSRLASELGVSRITVANAFKRLSAEGFVQLEPHKEAVVAPLERQDIRQVFLMRAELEELCAREAALLITAEVLGELHSINEEIGQLEKDESSDLRAKRAVDLRFHRCLRRASGMPLLVSTLDNLADRSEGYRARLLDSHHIYMPTTARHVPILEALENRNAVRAGELMNIHVLEGLEAITAMLERSSFGSNL